MILILFEIKKSKRFRIVYYVMFVFLVPTQIIKNIFFYRRIDSNKNELF